MSDTMNAVSLGSDAAAVGTNYALEVSTPISGGPQPVSDSQGNPSALSIGKAFVGVNTSVPDLGTAFTVSRDTPASPMLSVCNPGKNSGPGGEASIRYVNNASGHWWHVGTGGGAGAGNFFIWGEKANAAFTVQPSGDATFAYNLAVNGSLNVKGTLNLAALNVSALHGVPSAATAPAGTQLAALAIDVKTGKLYALGQQVP